MYHCVARCTSRTVLAILSLWLVANAPRAAEPVFDADIFNAKSKLPVIHMFSGADNLSHVEITTLAAMAGKFGTSFIDAGAQAVKLGYTADGATLDYHNANHRTLLIAIQGTMVFETGDGQMHPVPPGGIVLAEDRVGKGHANRCSAPTGTRQCMMLQVTLRDDETGLRPPTK